MLRRKSRRRAAGRRAPRMLLVVAVVLFEVTATWLRTHRLGGNTVVRCGKGHLFTTIWIPAASLKSLRLGFWRFQWCPVGRHFSLVTPIREDRLSDDERRIAAEHRDIRIP